MDKSVSTIFDLLGHLSFILVLGYINLSVRSMYVQNVTV